MVRALRIVMANLHLAHSIDQLRSFESALITPLCHMLVLKDLVVDIPSVQMWLTFTLSTTQKRKVSDAKG
jgi:hypothetical protein